MKILLLCPWKAKRNPLDSIEEDYLKRLKLFQIETVYLGLSSHQPFQLEDFLFWQKKNLKNASPTKIFPLNDSGKIYTTASFKNLMEKNLTIPGPMIFVFGTAYGFEQTFLQNYPQQISLSPLTFPHKLAKLILTEQIYRAESILQNLEYHHE
jgi:23S rRNA (pseudouridine1915-N3)-methyltransferase